MAVDVDDRDLDGVPAPLLQLFELLCAGFDRLAARRTHSAQRRRSPPFAAAPRRTPAGTGWRSCHWKPKASPAARAASTQKPEHDLIAAFEHVFQPLHVLERNSLPVALASVREAQCPSGILTHLLRLDGLTEDRFEVDVAAADSVVANRSDRLFKKRCTRFLSISTSSPSPNSAHIIEAQDYLLLG